MSYEIFEVDKSDEDCTWGARQGRAECWRLTDDVSGESHKKYVEVMFDRSNCCSRLREILNEIAVKIEVPKQCNEVDLNVVVPGE